MQWHISSRNGQRCLRWVARVGNRHREEATEENHILKTTSWIYIPFPWVQGLGSIEPMQKSLLERYRVSAKPAPPLSGMWYSTLLDIEIGPICRVLPTTYWCFIRAVRNSVYYHPGSLSVHQRELSFTQAFDGREFAVASHRQSVCPQRLFCQGCY